MTHHPDSLREKARKLLIGQKTGVDQDIFNNLEKLIEEYNIFKIELELQQEELARANQELEEKNNQLDDLFENAPVGYFILNNEGLVSELNTTAAKMIELPKEKIIGQPFHQLVHPLSQDHFYFYFQRIHGKNEPGIAEISLVTKQKQHQYFLLNSIPFIDPVTNAWKVRVSATNVTGIKEAEVLRDSERRYRLLFKNMINGLLVLKPVFNSGELIDFRFFRANAAFEKITGLNPRNMENAPFMHIFPDNGQEILSMLMRTLVLTTNQKIENFALKNNVVVNLYSFLPEEEYVSLIIEDVTTQVLAERERNKNEELIRTIFKILPVGVTITNSSGNIVDCNPASEELLGLRKEEHLIRNFAGKEWQIIRPDLSPMSSDEFASVRALRENRIIENIEMGIVKSKGDLTWISVSAAPIPLPDMGVAIVYSDITERVNAQEETEEKFKNIIQNSTDAIIIVNQSGAIIEWNKGCELIFGYKRKIVLGQKIWRFIEKVIVNKSAASNKSLFSEESINVAILTGESKWFKRVSEMEILDACSKPKILQSVAFPVKTVNGFLLGVIARDITEAKNAEKMLTIAKEKAEEANRIKSQFLANISHEIRTPLNAIMGFTEILREFKVSDKKFTSHLTGIEKSSKALMALINDILDLSRIEAGKMALNPTEFTLNNLVKDVRQIFSLKAEQKGLELETIISDNVPKRILLDELRLRQILFNLVGNAVKFTERGSIIIDVDSAVNENRPSQVTLYIKVIDTGPGIHEKDLEAIFDPFFQKQPGESTKQEGTGLGLAISRRFAEMMNGIITVSSHRGKGTEFLLTIPQVPVVEKQPKTQENEKPEIRETEPSAGSQKELISQILDELIKKTGSRQMAKQFIDQQIWSEYDKIADILGFDEVVSFSAMLTEIASKNQLSALKEFATRLNHEATAFNVIEINRMLTGFETLRNI